MHSIHTIKQYQNTTHIHKHMHTDVSTCHKLVVMSQATWQGGWDVVTPGDVETSHSLKQLLHASPQDHVIGGRLQLQRGHVLQHKDQPCRQFHILLSVSTARSPDSSHSYIRYSFGHGT